MSFDKAPRTALRDPNRRDLMAGWYLFQAPSGDWFICNPLGFSVGRFFWTDHTEETVEAFLAALRESLK